MKTIWSLQCVVQRNFNVLSNVANAFGNIANTFKNNNSMLESVQCIFQRIFNAFLTYLLCRVFATCRVTLKPRHPTKMAIRPLVSFTLQILPQQCQSETDFKACCIFLRCKTDLRARLWTINWLSLLPLTSSLFCFEIRIFRRVISLSKKLDCTGTAKLGSNREEAKKLQGIFFSITLMTTCKIQALLKKKNFTRKSHLRPSCIASLGFLLGHDMLQEKCFGDVDFWHLLTCKKSQEVHWQVWTMNTLFCSLR